MKLKKSLNDQRHRETQSELCRDLREQIDGGNVGPNLLGLPERWREKKWGGTGKQGKKGKDF